MTPRRALITSRGTGRLRSSKSLLLLVAGVFIFAHLFVEMGGNLFGRVLQNALHLPAFFLMGLFLAWYFPRWNAWRLFGLSVLISAGFEFLQVFGSRNASILDLGLDLVGLGVAILAARGPWATWKGLIGGVLLIGAVTSAYPIRVQLAYQHRDNLFPRLFEAGSWRQAVLLSGNSPLQVVPGGQVESVEEDSSRLCFAELRYPGVRLDEVVENWRGFEFLLVDLYVEGDEPLWLTVAVGHRGTEGTSAFVSNEFGAGRHQWRTSLNRLTRSADGSQALITHLILHSSRAYADRCVLLIDVGLE